MRRFRTLNENAFDVLTDDAAYWLGLLMTDGCLQLTHSAFYLTLGLKASDETHVRLFQTFLSSDHKIITCKRYGTKTLTVFCRQLGERLISLGVTPRKTHTATAPDELAFSPHFWRGCIDGDGTLQWLYKAPTRIYPCIAFGSASHRLCCQFAAYVASIGAPDRPPILRNKQNPKWNDFWNWQVNGAKTMPIIHALYGHGGVALARKQTLANEFIQREKH